MISSTPIRIMMRDATGDHGGDIPDGGWRALRSVRRAAGAAVRADRLALRDILCMCRIGVSEEERREPQKIEVDVELFLPLEQAGRAGDLRRAIDYRDVCQAVRGLLETTGFHLIEAAGARTLDLLLERFPARRAIVRVRKFVLPNVGHVEVQMERGRDAPPGGAQRPGISDEG
jgi:dihydroneopterin aldolase